MADPTYSEVSRILKLEPETGKLFWLERPRSMFANDQAWGSYNTRFAGKEAFAHDGRGYKRGFLLSRTKYYAHRVVWLLHYGEWPKGIIDHIDGDKSNNRVSNLREVTKSLNARNMKRQKSNKSGMNGVSRHALTGKWRARIEVERVTICLGLYDNFDDACEARKAANLRHGFSERHGA